MVPRFDMANSNYLKIIYEKTAQTTMTDSYEYRNRPFANSLLYEASIKSFQLLTQGSDVKTVYQLELVLKDITFGFLPGDVIAILPENDEKEVKELLMRLNLWDVCLNTYNLEVLKDTTKKNVKSPKHLPQNSTLYNTFLKHIDIRAAPKKAFLKCLIEYTNETTEREKLKLICSPSGSNEFVKFLEDNRSFLSLFNSLPSCHPPIELILEHSGPLNPRYFSIASSPLSSQLRIIFYVLELGNGLKGVCTGWLERIINDKEFKTKKIPIYFRKPGNFRFFNIDTPNILVSTGTGLAPFLSFLQHKKCMCLSGPSLSETWLFYGCRYSKGDFLCQNELKSFLDDRVLTKLSTAFSRDGEKKMYVQHRIFECKKELTDLILNRNAFVFVCGDSKTVVKDIKEMFIKCFMACRQIDKNSAEDILQTLVEKDFLLTHGYKYK